MEPEDTQEREPQSGRFAVYIFSNRRNGTLYTGMTNDLVRRSFEHRNGTSGGFARRYRLHKLVYWELHSTAWSAIEREKQIKAGSRRKKLDLIEGLNPEWRDLYEDVVSPEE